MGGWRKKKRGSSLRLHLSGYLTCLFLSLPSWSQSEPASGCGVSRSFSAKPNPSLPSLIRRGNCWGFFPPPLFSFSLALGSAERPEGEEEDELRLWKSRPGKLQLECAAHRRQATPLRLALAASPRFLPSGEPSPFAKRQRLLLISGKSNNRRRQYSFASSSPATRWEFFKQFCCLWEGGRRRVLFLRGEF